jgi:hypothetical protein
MKNLIRKILREVTEGDKPTVIFVGGLEHRRTDRKLNEQVSLLKQGLGSVFNIKSFHHNDNIDSILNSIESSYDPYIVMFSAGCKHCLKITNKVKELEYNTDKIYIVEPCTCVSDCPNTKKNVLSSIDGGVPLKNVFGGNSDCTGKNVAGTPREGKDHWSAIGSVGKSIKNSYVEPVEDKGRTFNDYEYDDPHRYSDTLHPDNYRLNEQEFGEEEVDPFNDTLFAPKFMERVMRMMDDDPDFFMKEMLPGMNLSEEQEINIIYNYLTQYDRKNYYVPVHFDADELSNFFSEDRDYVIQHYAKKYFEQDYDYGYDSGCYDFDTYYFDMVDKVNVYTMREKYIHESFGDEPNEEEFKEFVAEEFGNDIGCAMAEAQNSADIDYLHSDIRNGAEDYLSEFNGIISNNVDKDGNRGWKLEFNGKREIGDVVNSEMFKETLHDHVHSGYSLLSDIFNDIFTIEREGDNYYDNVLLPEEKIYINTDIHFRYGGAGDVDPQYFNEILSGKLSWH